MHFVNLCPLLSILKIFRFNIKIILNFNKIIFTYFEKMNDKFIIKQNIIEYYY